MDIDLYNPSLGQRLFGELLPDYDELQGCIRCGRCLPVCPTYQQTQLEMFSPRGRLSLLRAVEDGKLGISPGVTDHLYHCLDCRACNTVCPPGVPIGQLILRGRVAVERQHQRPWLTRFVLLHFVAGARRAEFFSVPLRTVRALRLDRLAALLLGRIPGFGAKIRDLVELSPGLGRPVRRELAPGAMAWGTRRHRVAYFLGCMMNVAMPTVSRATVRVLTRAGCDVVTPQDPACCGAPHDDQAMLGPSREMARRNVALFEPLLDEVEAIVTDCAGCSAALKEYEAWLKDDPVWASRARRFSAKVRDVTEWLDEIWPSGLRLKHRPARVTYHDPCHLANVQGVCRQPRNLLCRVEGLELVSLPDSAPIRCCGSAGVYNITHTPMSLQLLARKMSDVAATGAEVVVSANPGCLIQLDWGRRRTGIDVAVRHIVELLDESLGYESEANPVQ